MADMLILEDQKLNMERLATSVGRLSIDLVTNSLDFRKYIDEGNRSALWFLDDGVPDRGHITGGDFPSFVENCAYLLERLPNAKVYYTGTFPEPGAMNYLREHEIKLVEKSDIAKIVQEELPNV